MAEDQPLNTYLNLCQQAYDLMTPEPTKKEFEFYGAYIKKAKGLILEPMCGTGRFLLPFLAQGLEVHGFDASKHMLKALDEKSKVQNLYPTVWHGFLEYFQALRKYSLIFIPGGSFGLVIDLETVEACLKNIHDSLEKDGIFLFESETLCAVPLSSQFNHWHSSVWYKDNGTFIIASFLSLPRVDNVNRLLSRYELVEGNCITQSEVEDFKVRVYAPDVLKRMLKKIGFKQVNIFKRFNRAATISEQDSMIVYECIK